MNILVSFGIIIGLSEIAALSSIYETDRTMRLLSENGIRQYQTRPLGKWKYLFLIYKRKEGVITRYAFLWMVIYYFINGIGFFALYIQFITENPSFIRAITCIICFANLGLLYLSIYQPKISYEQREIYKWHKNKLRDDNKSRD